MNNTALELEPIEDAEAPRSTAHASDAGLLLSLVVVGLLAGWCGVLHLKVKDLLVPDPEWDKRNLDHKTKIQKTQDWHGVAATWCLLVAAIVLLTAFGSALGTGAIDDEDNSGLYRGP